MIVRITTIVVEYRKWNRKRLVERVLKERKEDMNKEKDKEKKKKKGGVANPKSQKYKDTNIQTIPTNGRDKELKEQDSFAIKPLNMSKISGDKGLNIFNEFKKQTKLESHVTLLTIKRTMTCFFAIIFSVPFFIETTYKSYLSEFIPMADTINDMINAGVSQSNINIAFQMIVTQHQNDFDNLVGLEATNFTYKSSDYMNDNIRKLNLYSLTEKGIKFTIDLSHTIKLYAVCGLCGYVISGILLVAFVVYINSDLSNFVIYPLESIIEKVTIFSRNPMAATVDDFANKAGIASLLQSKAGTSQDEIHLIDSSIMKIAYLLAAGYGEAGTNMIVNNMQAKSGDIDISGEKVVGIYGFCDIRNFTDATEVLQQKVMTFVNKIASIVHINIVKMGGCNNKNIGDAFLFLWKIASYKEAPGLALRLQDYIDKKEPLPEEEHASISIICDVAVYCVIKIIAKINSYQQILSYREHPGLNERIPEYAVKMGFGLHLGWAIEGLIGSAYKVDASYLSPNVNLASRLEAATKQYGVNFLFSEIIYSLLSVPYKKKCRCVDRCTLKGVAHPLYLYTLEAELTNLPKVKDRYLKMTFKQRQKTVNKERDLLFEKLMSGEVTTKDLIEQDKEMRRMLHFHNYASREPFIKSYKKAFHHYLKGNWIKTKEYLEKCLLMDNHDGPSRVLLEYIKEQNYESKSVNWQGYRVLTEK